MKKHLLARALVVAAMLTLLIAPFGASAASYGLVSFWGDVRLGYSNIFDGGLAGCTVELYRGDTLLASNPVENVAGAFAFHKNLGPGSYTIKVVGVDDAYIFGSVTVGGKSVAVSSPEVTFEVTSAQIPGQFGPIVFKYNGGQDPECNPDIVYFFGRAVDRQGNGVNGVQWAVLGVTPATSKDRFDSNDILDHGVTGGSMPDGSDGGWFLAAIPRAQYNNWVILAHQAPRASSNADIMIGKRYLPVPRYAGDPWAIVDIEGGRWQVSGEDFECMPTVVGAHPTVGFLFMEAPQF